MTAEAINAQIDTNASNEQVKQRADTAFAHIVRTFKGSAWPSPAHFSEAMRETVPRKEVSAEVSQQWTRPPEMSLRELRWRRNYEGAKYHLSAEENEIAKTQPIPRCEREHHEAMMDRLEYQSAEMGI